MAEAFAPFCNTCYGDLPPRRFALTRRTEAVYKKLIEGKSITAVNVLGDEILLMFCGFPCWQGKEAEIIEVFELKETYPTFSWTAACSICGKAINRTQPYVALSRCELEIIEKPWVALGKVFDDVEFAVLCNDCCAPTLPAAEVEIQEEGMEEAESVSPVGFETVTD